LDKVRHENIWESPKTGGTKEGGPPHHGGLEKRKKQGGRREGEIVECSTEGEREGEQNTGLVMKHRGTWGVERQKSGQGMWGKERSKLPKNGGDEQGGGKKNLVEPRERGVPRCQICEGTMDKRIKNKKRKTENDNLPGEQN